jgi:hypothetical protein
MVREQETRMNETSAKFLPHGVEVTETSTRTGVKSTKLVDYNSFFEAVNKNIILQTGLIPPGTRYFSRYHGEVIALMEEAPRIEEMTFHDRRGDDKGNITARIPVPGILIGVRLNEGHGIVKANVWALKTAIKTIDDPIYHCPLGNTYMGRENQNFCWGTTTEMWKQIKEPHQLRSLMNIFYTSTFNSDLSPCYKTTADIESGKLETIGDLWRFIKNKEEFPTKLLMEAGTFQSAIKSMEGSRS